MDWSHAEFHWVWMAHTTYVPERDEVSHQEHSLEVSRASPQAGTNLAEHSGTGPLAVAFHGFGVCVRVVWFELPLTPLCFPISLLDVGGREGGSGGPQSFCSQRSKGSQILH